MSSRSGILRCDQHGRLLVLRAWAKRHRKALWVTAGVAGAGLGSYYFVSLLRGKAESRAELEEAQAALLRQEAEDRAEAQYAQFSNLSGALCDVHICMLLP